MSKLAVLAAILLTISLSCCKPDDRMWHKYYELKIEQLEARVDSLETWGK